MSRAGYHWVVEELDNDDIMETQAYFSAAEAVAAARQTARRHSNIRLGLVREDYRLGGARSWAYVNEKFALPDEFDDGTRVPRRFSVALTKLKG